MITLFVEPVSKKLVCMLCGKVFKDPVITSCGVCSFILLEFCFVHVDRVQVNIASRTKFAACFVKNQSGKKQLKFINNQCSFLCSTHSADLVLRQRVQVTFLVAYSSWFHRWWHNFRNLLNSSIICCSMQHCWVFLIALKSCWYCHSNQSEFVMLSFIYTIC